MNLLPLLVVVAVAILVFYMQRCRLACKCNGRDDYGQDASIRANSGWVAGPMYGYDPINKFAEEIEESKMGFRKKVQEAGCVDACSINQDVCALCLADAGLSETGIETLVIGIMPLDGPVNPRPGYKKSTKYPLWDPAEAKFNEGFRKRGSCPTCS